MVNSTTEAPTTPEGAAGSTPIPGTDKPIPVALPPSAACAPRRARSATPDFSRILLLPEAERYRDENASASDGLLVMPFCHDALSARMIEQAGFDLAFLSGFGASAAPIGAPGLGLTTKPRFWTRRATRWAP